MLSIVHSTALQGLEGCIVRVEVDVSNGLPCFDLVGLGDIAVKESRDRVRTAIKNSGFEFPVKRIIVNLAPGNLKKEGPMYDLAVAISILAATNQIAQEVCQDFVFIGELSLNGEVRAVTGVLPNVMTAAELGFASVVVPMENAAEAALVKQIKVYPVASLTQLVCFLSGQESILPYAATPEERDFVPKPDFVEVKGQYAARRALEIAAAGGHNILMVGSPGSGKTLLARCVPGIMPRMNDEESLETAKLYSLAGLFPYRKNRFTQRPFRAPHHSASAVALVGGGKYPRPGEISLAHNGVLFLDEMPEFHKDALEALRQPLEDGIVTISRVNATVQYPAQWMLVGACNPCPCGFRGDMLKECTCNPAQIQRYMGRLSGPLLDRIDMVLHIPRVTYEELTQDQIGESSAQMQKRVQAAREIQWARFALGAKGCNAVLTGKAVKQHCELTREAKNLLQSAFQRFHLSARSHNRILKVARTVADLANSLQIEAAHLAEAIQFRGENKMPV